MIEALPQKHSNEGFDQDWDRLQQLLKYLTSLGLAVHSISRDYFDDFVVGQGMPTPIAGRGGDGIRMSYEKRRGLLVWFTNEFENPEDETRKNVQEYWSALQDKG